MPRVSWSTVDGKDCLRLAGLDEDRQVRVRPLLAGAPAELPPMAGTLVGDAGDLCFVPRFGFVGGTGYGVEVDGATMAELVRPLPERAATTSITAIYPSAAEVPRNLLRLYVQFSAPMREGRAFSHLRLLDGDGDGAEMAGALLAMDHELWDPGRRRLTVLLDPARIKRGLVPNREAGYPLRTGGSFRLVVDASFQDAQGAPLRTPAERRYAVGGDERRRVRPDTWRLDVPAAGTTGALCASFDRPLDHALLAGCLRLHDPLGEPVRGRVSIGPKERSWRFEPAETWAPGRYQLAVDPVLEDLAGNSVARVFDRDLGRAEDDPADGGPSLLHLVVR